MQRRQWGPRLVLASGCVSVCVGDIPSQRTRTTSASAGALTVEPEVREGSVPFERVGQRDRACATEVVACTRASRADVHDRMTRIQINKQRSGSRRAHANLDPMRHQEQRTPEVEHRERDVIPQRVREGGGAHSVNAVVCAIYNANSKRLSQQQTQR